MKSVTYQSIGMHEMQRISHFGVVLKDMLLCNFDLTHWPMEDVEIVLQVCLSNSFYKLLSWSIRA